MHLKDEELVTGLAGQEGGLDLLAATFARVTTAVSFTRMLTPLGNYFIARPAARAAAGKITKETDVPLDAAVVLGLSAGALHVWSADPMLNQVGEYLGHVPLERITAIEATPGAGKSSRSPYKAATRSSWRAAAPAISSRPHSASSVILPGNQLDPHRPVRRGEPALTGTGPPLLLPDLPITGRPERTDTGRSALIDAQTRHRESAPLRTDGALRLSR